jgi:outer membrane receptor protein involved in Fe transport
MNFRSGNPAPRRQSSRAVYPLLLVFAVQTAGPGTALADEPILEEVVVEGRRLVLTGQARSASEGVIGQQDLELRPLLRPGDVLEAIPGLIVTQHSGSGKSNQMFLRGFNLDHGTDFATWIDGMPVNMRTHGHGQGYTDINFLIPETIQYMEYVKGPYHAELGDFSSAGGAHIRLFDEMPGNQLQLGAGEDGFQRALAMGGLHLGPGHLSGALELQAYDGPWRDIEEDVEKVNGLLRYTGGTEERSWRLTGMYYDNSWNSADQIPERAVSRGLIDELGSIDRTLGGESTRASLSGGARFGDDVQRLDISAYIIDYEMDLWSNFTYRLDDPDNGDQFQQVDDRMVYGGALHGHWTTALAAGDLDHRAGLEFRYDDIDEVGLYRTLQRRKLSSVRVDEVEVSSAAAYYEAEWALSPSWRSVVGLRYDYYWFDVSADLAANSGDEEDSIFSPKASLMYSFSDTAEAYLSGGYGFHSNDARGTTISIDPASGEPVDQVDPLVESKGAELGFKALWRERWNMSLALWYLELDSELLFVGDAGNTEATRPSQRWGVEFNNYWTLGEIWSVEADLAWTDAKFDDNAPEGDEIPGALETVATGAVTAQFPSGWFGSFRLRYFGEAPLVEDNSVESDGSTLANLAMGWQGDHWSVQLDALNLFDSDDHDIDYFYASRLRGEPAEGVEDIHYHVFEPRQFRLHVSYRP